ncbi:hypothetical protein AEGHOMDF_2746 [Methylobacterium soli]|nr:hypothetical protein AEGHOMDF_2746 [Methylobacterium soli]
MVAAMRPGELGLLGGADGADHGGAEMLGPLAGDEADAPGGGVEQDGVAGLHREGPVQQVLGGEPLQHHGGGGGVVDALRHLHGGGRGDQGLLRVGALARAVSDPVADLEARDPLAHGRDLARPLLAGREGQLGRLVGAGAEVDVDEVHPDRALAHPDLAGARLGARNLRVGHHLGAAILLNSDRLRHRELLDSAARGRTARGAARGEIRAVRSGAMPDPGPGAISCPPHATRLRPRAPFGAGGMARCSLPRGRGTPRDHVSVWT